MINYRRLLLPIIIGLVVLLVGGLVWFCYWRQPCFQGGYQLDLPDGQMAEVGLLTTKKQKQLGFSHQEQPCLDCGLLFVWPVLSQPKMVMREMLFSLDFVWLRDRQIVQLTENVVPEDKQPLTNYQPSQPIDVVLEVPAGFIQRHNLQVGQSLNWR
jgi:hypothetical protein